MISRPVFSLSLHPDDLFHLSKTLSAYIYIHVLSSGSTCPIKVEDSHWGGCWMRMQEQYGHHHGHSKEWLEGIIEVSYPLGESHRGK